MEARFESAHRSQIQRQEVKKEGTVGFRRQRNHFPFLILPGVIVDPLQVGGLSAQTRTVVHQLTVDFARRKIDERHFVLTRLSPKTYSTRFAPGPNSRHQSSRTFSGRAIAESFQVLIPANSSQEKSLFDYRIADHPAAALTVSATTPSPAQ